MNFKKIAFLMLVFTCVSNQSVFAQEEDDVSYYDGFYDDGLIGGTVSTTGRVTGRAIEGTGEAAGRVVGGPETVTGRTVQHSGAIAGEAVEETGDIAGGVLGGFFVGGEGRRERAEQRREERRSRFW